MSLLVLSIIAVAAALAAMAYAWRIARTDRLRSDARVAALAAAIDGTPEEADTTAMFAREPRSGLQGRPLLKLGVGFAMAVLVIVLIAMSGDRHSTSADEREPVASGKPARRQLELLSMRHIRTGDGLTVTGSSATVVPPTQLPSRPSFLSSIATAGSSPAAAHRWSLRPWHSATNPRSRLRFQT
jgi:hypothetical protein